MRHNHHTFRRGFTLIELIVAMGIVAILAGALFTSLRTAFMASNHATAVIVPVRNAELALDFVRQDLQNAITPNANPDDLVVFAGNFEGTQNASGDDLQFYGTSDGPQHPDCNGEIKWIELTVYTPNGSNTPCLVRRVLRNLTAETPPNYDEDILCRNVTAFTMQYFNGSVWATSWDSTAQDNTLPAAVQITLQVTNLAGGGNTTYVRTFSLPCSTAAQDTTVNSGGGGL